MSKRINLAHGYVTVPTTTKVVDISEYSDANYAAVISDRAGVLPSLLVLSDKSLCNIDAVEEDAVVSKAIKGLEQYQDAKAEELPYPTGCNDEKAWLDWNESFRLSLIPVEMLLRLDSEVYQLNRDEE